MRACLWGWTDPTVDINAEDYVSNWNPGVYEKAEEKFLQIVAIRDRLLDVR